MSKHDLTNVACSALLKFWFRFVFPNTSILRSAGARQAFAERIVPSLEAWFGSCFEQLCREALPLIYLDEVVHAGFEVGEFWSKETQIDIVGVRDDNWTDLGECKWGRFGSTRALVDELEGKIARYPNTRGATLGRRYFVRRKPARASAPGRYSLDDLYALPLGGGQDDVGREPPVRLRIRFGGRTSGDRPRNTAGVNEQSARRSHRYARRENQCQATAQ